MKTLEDVNQEKAAILFPACIFLASLAIFGLIGNSLVCYVFGARLRPGTQNSLIVCLAVFDLLSCALGIPNEIADMQFYFTYNSEAACKIMRFINMFTSLGSIFTLLFIAIDRYRKVCLPFKRQLHMRHMKVFIVPVIMGGAMFFAWPSLLVYGLRSAETGFPGLRGRDCSASEALRGTLFPLIYNSVLFGGFIIIVIALACLYFQVLRGTKKSIFSIKKNGTFCPYSFSCKVRKKRPLCQQKSVVATMNSSTSASASTSTTQPSASATFELTREAVASSSSLAASMASSCTLDSHYSRLSSSPPDEFERSTSSSATLTGYPRHRHNDSRKLRGHRGHGRRSRTTTIALLVTLIFVASFLPHLCLQAAQLMDEGFAANLGGSASLAYNAFLRSYFINSAANPVLYGILNVKFNAEVRALVGR
ncbi:hypothetical protein EGW08_021652, partial [Elysia chlorotica]